MGPIGAPVAGVEKDNKKNKENKAVVEVVEIVEKCVISSFLLCVYDGLL